MIYLSHVKVIIFVLVTDIQLITYDTDMSATYTTGYYICNKHTYDVQVIAYYTDVHTT